MRLARQVLKHLCDLLLEVLDGVFVVKSAQNLTVAESLVDEVLFDPLDRALVCFIEVPFGDLAFQLRTQHLVVVLDVGKHIFDHRLQLGEVGAHARLGHADVDEPVGRDREDALEEAKHDFGIVGEEARDDAHGAQYICVISWNARCDTQIV